MKSININVVLIIIIGIASGSLLLPESLFSPGRQLDETLPETKTVQNVRVSKVVKSELPSSADTTRIESMETEFSVIGLNEKPSNLYVAVFESDAGFPKSELSNSTKIISATDKQVRFSLDLPQDMPVAIAVFQDIDGNGKLSKNAIGIPTEPYGFSNNARGVMGPPSFDDAVFTVSDSRSADVPMEIRVR